MFINNSSDAKRVKNLRKTITANHYVLPSKSFALHVLCHALTSISVAACYTRENCLFVLLSTVYCLVHQRPINLNNETKLIGFRNKTAQVSTMVLLTPSFSR